MSPQRLQTPLVAPSVQLLAHYGTLVHQTPEVHGARTETKLEGDLELRNEGKEQNDCRLHRVYLQFLEILLYDVRVTDLEQSGGEPHHPHPIDVGVLREVLVEPVPKVLEVVGQGRRCDPSHTGASRPSWN